jgi:DNA-binding HxlR family transcriptional regulator
MLTQQISDSSAAAGTLVKISTFLIGFGKFGHDVRSDSSTIGIWNMTAQERAGYLRLAVEIISEKWRLAALHLLSDSPLRRSHLQRALEAVSPKVLTQTLRGLERDGLVAREAYAAAPLWVEYRLTEMARHLLAALEDLCRWSETYERELRLSRSTYDAQAEPLPPVGRVGCNRAGDKSRQIVLGRHASAGAGIPNRLRA